MANKTFVPAPSRMSAPVVSMSNHIWDVELFYSVLDSKFELRFAGPDAQKRWAFGEVTEDGTVAIDNSLGHNIVPPKYVQEFATKMWRDNVA